MYHFDRRASASVRPHLHEANLAAWAQRNGAMVLISQLIVPLVERVSQRVQNSNR